MNCSVGKNFSSLKIEPGQGLAIFFRKMSNNEEYRKTKNFLGRYFLIISKKPIEPGSN